MKLRLATFIACGLGACLEGADFTIQDLSSAGILRLTNTFREGAVTVHEAPSPTGPWQAARNLFTTNTSARTGWLLTNAPQFLLAGAVDLAPELPFGRGAFTNLTRLYGRLTTLAGKGTFRTDNVSFWRPEFEGGPATNADLSRPHIAMADQAGNVYIADKSAHAIRMVRPDGIIVTVAGTNAAGNAPDEPTPALQAPLNQPNGLWVQPDGTVYIVDLGNNKIRKLTPDGLLSTVVPNANFNLVGRGLWVNESGTELYYSARLEVHKWTPAEGLRTFATGFSELGNLHRHPLTGDLIATDRGSHYVWRIESDGGKAVLAGNGLTYATGDGVPALETGFNGVRTAWFLPTGAYFLGTHDGEQIWYVDTVGLAHLFIQGARYAHAGDGTWFFNLQEARLSEPRAITADHDGNLLITESDYGFVRRIEFLPMPDNQ